MKNIATKLLFSVGIVTICYSIFLLCQTYSLTNTRVREVVEQQASMALEFNLAIRKYIGENVRPVMYKLLGQEEFIPETMSTSYVARTVFEDVRKEFPDYIIKFSSDNPRNPINQAGPEELKVIEYLNNNPDLNSWEGMVSIDGKQYMAKFRARRMEESCLRCHGDPKDAPASLLKRYGAVAGFHRPIGMIIGSDTVAIPMKKIYEQLWSESMPTILVSALALFFFFLAIIYITRFIIINRLTMISQHFINAAQQEDYSGINPIKIKGRDEISNLAFSFNTLTDRLKEYYTSLEMQVKERTIKLEDTNKQLREEIDERKRAEEAALANAERVRVFFSSINDAIFVHPLKEEGFAPFVEVNDIACERYGYSREEFLQLSAPDITKKEDVSVHSKRGHRSKLLDEGHLVFEAVHIKKSGETFPVEIDSNIVYQFGAPFILAVVRDITERKRREEALRESEEKLARSKKMESLGLLAGGVAHDLNNILSGIVSYPELLLLDLPKDSKLRKPIETIQETGNRAAAIVQDLITVARGVAITKEPLNLNDLIGDFLNSPEFKKLEQFHSTLTFKTNLDTELCNIGGSHVHIRKVVMNLVSNASEAIEASGTVTISTMNRYIDRPLRGYDDVSIGEYVVLAVSDDGPGISPDDLARIFEPFYTKKVMGRSGTGLGLAVVWNVVQDHRGYIDVTTDGTGTTFELYFPITREKISDQDLSVPVEDYKGNGETILVVDDIESQREISCKMLDKLGYKTHAVSSGEEAVEYLKDHTVDLILLDMIMDPGINGRETYEQIIKIHPNQKAIIASGFAETDEVKEAQKLGAGQYIKKPLTLEKVGIAVRDELKK
jgi:two-component system cell cycle sensor histidine kinase/response regulator CckA